MTSPGQSRLDQAAPHASAAYWVATLSDGHCTDEERQQFCAWLRSSTKNVEEFLRLSTLLRGLENERLWPQLDSAALIAAARAHSSVATLPHIAPPRPNRFSARRISLAAAVLCTIGLTFTTVSSHRFLERLTSTYGTEIGEQRSIALEDGSVIRLNGRSRIHTHFDAHFRVVELLEGEAIFKVAKDHSRPFLVRTRRSEIRAVGTQFNVKTQAQGTVVTVLEGRVRVNDLPRGAIGSGPDIMRPPVELVPGQQLIIEAQRPPVRVTLPNPRTAISWTERRLVFDAVTVADAAAEFARYSSKVIRIEDADLAQRRITAVFDTTEPDSLVQFLATDPAVAIVPEGDGWRVTRRTNAQLNR